MSSILSSIHAHEPEASIASVLPLPERSQCRISRRRCLGAGRSSGPLWSWSSGRTSAECGHSAAVPVAKSDLASGSCWWQSPLGRRCLSACQCQWPPRRRHESPRPGHPPAGGPSAHRDQLAGCPGPGPATNASLLQVESEGLGPGSGRAAVCAAQPETPSPSRRSGPGRALDTPGESSTTPESPLSLGCPSPRGVSPYLRDWPAVDLTPVT